MATKKNESIKRDFHINLLSIHIIIYISMIIFLHIHSLSFAELYKHIDNQGIVHFSNLPLEKTFCGKVKKIKKLQNKNNQQNIASIDNIIDYASRQFNIDNSLIRAIIKVESDFNPKAVSPAGAQGLMQLMPNTANLMNVKDTFDSEDNIMGGTKYLSYLLEKFDNDIKLALAAYNAGETAVKKYNGIPNYPETINYVKKVLDYNNQYSSKSQGGTQRIYKFKDVNNVLHITNMYQPKRSREQK